MSQVLQKDEAHKLIDQMSPTATGDDLLHQIYVRKATDKGMSDSKEGRIRQVSEVRAKYGLPQ